MFLSLGAFWIFVPLFFMAFMFSVVSMSQGSGHLVGLILMIVTLTGPALQSFNKIDLIFPFTHSVNSSFPLRQAPPVPIADDRALVEKINAEPLSAAHAWQVQVAHARILSNSFIGGSIDNVTFSADGEDVIFLRNGYSRPELVELRLRDQAVIGAWQLAGPPANYDWSPDGKRFVYITDGRLHIVDVKSGKDVAMPPVIPLGDQRNLSWASPDRILTGEGILDLESMETTAFQQGQTIGNLAEQFAAQFRTSPAHVLYKIEYKNGPRTGLFISEQDSSYEHPLVIQGQIVPAGRISPDQRHILAYSQGLLVHYYLGLQDPPQISFRIGLNSRAVLSAEEQKQVDEFRKKGVPFWGRVYSPLVNPWNDRLVGPYPDTLKGVVKLTDWRDTDVTATIASDLTLDHSIHDGDIVTDISSEQSDTRGNSRISYEKLWLPLQAIPSATATTPQNAAPSAK